MMTTSQYRNIIQGTVNCIPADKLTDFVYVANQIFKNMGVAFLSRSCSEIRAALIENQYMGWHECTAAEAQSRANCGYPAIGVNDDNLIIIKPEETTVSNSELNIISTADNISNNIVAVSSLSIQTRSSYSYFYNIDMTTQKGAKFPDRIAQNSTDPDWDASLWYPYASVAPTGCAVACISMSLSSIGIGIKPGNIISIMGGSSYIRNWNVAQWGYGAPTSLKTYHKRNATAAEIYERIQMFILDDPYYSPPIIGVLTKEDKKNHYVVACSYEYVSGTYRAIDPGYHGYYDYDYWNDNDITGQIIQYYYD